ncbi:MAG TPA: hypothetical protein VMS17_18330 [Gemmataceae bacterium]|nr:hypothetical protein [Gemmataceae bacterium]
MHLARTLSLVVAGLVLVAAAPSAEAAKKAKKEHAVKGVIASVEKDANTKGGAITLTIAAHTNKKTNVTTPAAEKTFKVNDKTTFLKVSGKKGATTEEPATFLDVKDGEKVAMTVKGDEVLEVKFHAKKAKKNK